MKDNVFKAKKKELERVLALCKTFEQISTICINCTGLSEEEKVFSFDNICEILEEFGKKWG